MSVSIVDALERELRAHALTASHRPEHAAHALRKALAAACPGDLLIVVAHRDGLQLFDPARHGVAGELPPRPEAYFRLHVHTAHEPHGPRGDVSLVGADTARYLLRALERPYAVRTVSPGYSTDGAFLGFETLEQECFADVESARTRAERLSRCLESTDSGADLRSVEVVDLRTDKILPRRRIALRVPGIALPAAQHVA